MSMTHMQPSNGHRTSPTSPWLHDGATASSTVPSQRGGSGGEDNARSPTPTKTNSAISPPPTRAQNHPLAC
eukprot:7354923-Prorocentrum_lima.AAC.1